MANKKTKKIGRLTLQFVPYSEIELLGSAERIRKLLGLVLTNKIVLLQGRLTAEEEARLIEDTMALIGNVKDFKGVELAVLSQKKEETPLFSLRRMKGRIAKALGAQNEITIIGSASIVREIKRDPSKLQLMLK